MTQLTIFKRPNLHGNLDLMNARSTRKPTQRHPVYNYSIQALKHCLQNEHWKKNTTNNFKNTLLHQHLWEFVHSLIKQVKSLQLHLKSVCTMILTHKIRNILKTAPCRACSTSPNLYSLTTVKVFPQTAPLYHDWDTTNHPLIWVVSHLRVLSNVVITLWATFWHAEPGSGNDTPQAQLTHLNTLQEGAWTDMRQFRKRESFSWSSVLVWEGLGIKSHHIWVTKPWLQHCLEYWHFVLRHDTLLRFGSFLLNNIFIFCKVIHEKNYTFVLVSHGDLYCVKVCFPINLGSLLLLLKPRHLLDALP